MSNHELGSIELSALKELTNVGLGHAATALSQMVGRQMMISIPSIDLMQMESIPSLIGGDEVPTIAVAMSVEGDLAGTLAFILRKGDAERMAACIHRGNLGGIEKKQLERSILLEVGNIVDSNYLNAISDMTGTQTVATVPVLIEDMAASVVSSILAEAWENNEEVALFETQISDEETMMLGFFIYIPAKGSVRKALRSLGIREAS